MFALFRHSIVIFSVFLVGVVSAQHEEVLTTPLPLTLPNSPSKLSPLVYPEDTSVGYAVSGIKKVGETPKASRRYIETPDPENIPQVATIQTVSGEIGGGGRTVLANNALHPPQTGVPSTLPARIPTRQAEPSQPIVAASAEEGGPRPVADPALNASANSDPYHPPVRTASFLGVVPGETHQGDVVKFWGNAVKTTAVDGQVVHLYSTEVLNHIEVFYKDDVVSSIVVRLDEPFPEEQVREVLKTELLKARPVMIPNESGEIIGEVFPEKGVLFLFAPMSEKQPGLLVKQIGIESVTSEPFVLRAEATLNDQPTEAKRDLNDAVRVNSKDAKAYWLLSQIELMEGNIDAAMIHGERAIRIDEKRPAFHLTLAKILTRMNRSEEAKEYLEEMLGICDRVPHERASALSMLGDLYRTSSKPDYETAIGYHSDAIRLATALAEHPNQTIRQTAKDVLFEAHLGAARDVAWGRWDKKEESIAKWVSKAEEVANDPEMIDAKRLSKEYPFKLAVCVLAAQVGLAETKDIEPYIRDVINTGEQLIQSTRDPILKRKYQWETGLSLYDAVQIHQLRKKYTPALKYGEIAAGYMESGIKGRKSDTDLYLLARLYFRLGAIHAIGNKNHRAAIEWFDHAKPIFALLEMKINPEELGRLGETLVSMGVSYWMTEQREEAVRLTEQGMQQIERGVQKGVLDPTALTIPYTNLSNMYKELGKGDAAQKYTRLATSVR